MRIKTITAQTPTEFDKAVNEALAEGWVLVKRDVLAPYEGEETAWPRMYYAEMQKNASVQKSGAIPGRICYNCRHYDRLEIDGEASPCHRCEGYSRWEVLL